MTNQARPKGAHAPSPFPLISVLPPHPQGRTLWVSDLHGRRKLLDSALKAASFDKTTDRLVIAGDLTDRGEESLECLMLLDEPENIFIKGNHCIELARNIRNLAAGREFIPSKFLGNEWLENAFKWAPGFLLRKAEQIERMPSVLVHYGNAPHERYHVVHGSLAKDITLFNDAEIDALLAGSESRSARMSSALEKRFAEISRAYDRAERKSEKGAGDAIKIIDRPWAKGLSLTVCGHLTVPDMPILAHSHLHIDTGACLADKYENCSLSLVEQQNVSASGFDLAVIQSSPKWGIRKTITSVPFDKPQRKFGLRR